MPAWLNKLTGKTKRNQHKLEEQLTINAVAQGQRAQYRARLQSEIRNLGVKYKAELEKVKSASNSRKNTNTISTAEKVKLKEEIDTLKGELKTLDAEFNKIRADYANKQKSITEKQQKIYTLNDKLSTTSRANAIELNKLRAAIVDKELLLTEGTDNYGYQSAVWAKKEWNESGAVPSYQNWGPPAPHNAAVAIAKEKIKTPENVLRIINKYSNNTTGGKRRKTLKRK